MTRDLGSIVRPAADLVQLAQEVRRANESLSAAEKLEQRTAEQAASARERAANARLTLGRLLVEARKAWPARGPKAKGWGDFLREQGIGEDSALRYMMLAGYVGEISRTDGDVRETPPRVPTYAEAGIKKAPTITAPTSLLVEALERAPATPEPRAPITEAPTRPVRVVTDEEREAAQQAHIARIQPPKMETREDRTRRLAIGWGEALAAIRKVRDEAQIHLTDATTSTEDFESVRKTIVSVARAALDELETAGALDAPEPRKRQLSILDGGKP